jgi:hypothetical protein
MAMSDERKREILTEIKNRIVLSIFDKEVVKLVNREYNFLVRKSQESNFFKSLKESAEKNLNCLSVNQFIYVYDAIKKEILIRKAKEIELKPIKIDEKGRIKAQIYVAHISEFNHDQAIINGCNKNSKISFWRNDKITGLIGEIAIGQTLEVHGRVKKNENNEIQINYINNIIKIGDGNGIN